MSTVSVKLTRVSGSIGGFGVEQPEKYRSCRPLPFRQWWLGPDKMPCEAAVAYVGVADEGLSVYVCLNDSDIFSEATADNQRLWQLGDVAEFFVKPGTDCLDYWEIHVAPTDHIMILHIPSRVALTSKAVSIEDVMVTDRGVLKRVEVVPEQQQWAVELTLPWKTFALESVPAPATAWQFAVCRYNYTGGLHEVEHSSIAPLSTYSFHCYEDYCELIF